MEELAVRPMFPACDACGEPFTSVAFGGSGNVNDTWLYELCVGCAERMTTISGAEANEFAARLGRTVELRYQTPHGRA